MYCSSGPKVGLTSAKESRTASLTVSLNIFIFQLHLQSSSLFVLRVGVWKCPKSGSQRWRQHETTQQNTKVIWKPAKVAWEDLFHRFDHAVLFGVSEHRTRKSKPFDAAMWFCLSSNKTLAHCVSRTPGSSRFQTAISQFKCWLFVLDVRVKCCGKKTGWSRKASGVSLVAAWAPEGSGASAKTVDPQFHFKGMEVWKQAGETHTEEERAEREAKFKDRTSFSLKNQVILLVYEKRALWP